MTSRAWSVARLSPIVVGLLVAAVVLPWRLAAAEAGAGTYSATLVAEAWYRAGAEDAPALDGCGIPVAGCAPVPEITLPSQYPSGTLHVGVAGGAEESRTYLTLANSSVPVGTDVLGGTLTLPVTTDSEAGTVAPETASLRACLVEGQVKNGVEGGLGGAPAVDCSVSSRAVFQAAKGSSGPLFTVELTPFAKELSLGQVSVGLVPGEEPGTAWHVAFSRSDRQTAGARTIRAVLRTTSDGEQPAETPIDEQPAETPIGEQAAETPATASAPDLPAVTPGLESAPQLPQVAGNPPVGPAGQAVAPVAVRALSGSDTSPATLLLPLLVVSGAVWVSRMFTRDLLPVRG